MHTTTIYPPLPALAPRAAGEAAEQYGLRALLFITAERLTCTVDDEGLALAAHCFRLAVCNPALTTTGAERLADVGRMITRARADRPAADPAAVAPAGAAIAPAGEDTPRQGPGAPLAPRPRPQAPPALARPVSPAPPTTAPGPAPAALPPVPASTLSAAELF